MPVQLGIETSLNISVIPTPYPPPLPMEWNGMELEGLDSCRLCLKIDFFGGFWAEFRPLRALQARFDEMKQLLCCLFLR